MKYLGLQQTNAWFVPSVVAALGLFLGCKDLRYADPEASGDASGTAGRATNTPTMSSGVAGTGADSDPGEGGAASAGGSGDTAGAATTPPTEEDPDALAGVPVPELDWQPCPDAPEPPVLCATVTVPLDYQNPNNGQTVKLNVVKAPAREAAKRQGVLFINYGGPGFGVAQRVAQGDRLPQPIQDAYDIIGLDPRGTGLSQPLGGCGLEADALNDDSTRVLHVTDPDGVPREVSLTEYLDVLQSDEAAQTQLERDAVRAEACATNPLVYHMSTADVARDMELLRRAMHEPKLNYFGLSYGTFLGTTYANLFPTTTGRMVLDSVLDPVQWTTGENPVDAEVPLFVRSRAAASTFGTFREFLRLCDLATPESCQLRGEAERQFYELIESVTQKPVDLTTGVIETINPEGKRIRIADKLRIDLTTLLNIVFEKMYRPGDWSSLAAQARQMLNGGDLPVEPFDPAPITGNSLAGSELIDAYPDLQLAGVRCADSDGPEGAKRFGSAARSARGAGLFGATLAWATSPCAVWPDTKSSRFVGPFNRTASTPPLILNNLYDPITPHSSAQKLAAMLPGARLLSVVGWGHIAAGNSTCADQALEDYLLSGALPEAGKACLTQNLPFGLRIDTPGVLEKVDENTTFFGLKTDFSRTIAQLPKRAAANLEAGSIAGADVRHDAKTPSFRTLREELMADMMRLHRR